MKHEACNAATFCVQHATCNKSRQRRNFERSNNSNTFMFANNRDFGKLFKVKQKCV